MGVSASLYGGKFDLAVANIHLEKAIEVEIKGLSEGAGENLTGVNTEEKLWVLRTSKRKYIFPKHSFTLLRWKALVFGVSMDFGGFSI